MSLGAERSAVLAALLDDLLPGDPPTPGAGEAGGARYVENLLTAFEHDPPRIWAGGPFSGRHGGEASFEEFIELSGWEAHAWRARIERWEAIYVMGLDALGDDYPDLDGSGRAARRDAAPPELAELAFTHGCESLYGDPVYGGNRDSTGWSAIEYRGDVQPAGYTDAEVSAPEAGP